MAGFKKRLNESIQFKLSFSLAVAILAIALVAGVLSFVSAYDEAHDLQDNTLRQMLVMLDRHPVTLENSKSETLASATEDDARIIVQHLAAPTSAVNNSTVNALLPIPNALADGLHTLELNGKSFRVLVKTGLGGLRTAAAQETDVRDEIARDSALHTLIPLLVLMPVLLLIVADLVRKMFQPIATLSTEIDQRSEHELYPVNEVQLPQEVRPFAVAINLLLKRVDQAMQTQRRFIDDAAHELRSPLTALSLQAESLAAAEMSDLARQRLKTLSSGIGRSQALLTQLLALSKAQATVEQPKSLVSVQRVYRNVLEALLPLADDKQIDIGLVEGPDAQLFASELDITTVVKNLVDNAIRYTHRGGRVDLAVESIQGYVVLKISDTGPGIKPAERQRVFDPFYRMLGSDQVGSGLGLSIVKAIADRLGAEIQLDYSDAFKHSGLVVSVRFLSN